jgi:hypothetical protein
LHTAKVDITAPRIPHSDPHFWKAVHQEAVFAPVKLVFDLLHQEWQNHPARNQAARAATFDSIHDIWPICQSILNQIPKVVTFGETVEVVICNKLA